MWIQFKGIDSREVGVTVIDLGRRQRAEEWVDSYEIPYRNEELTIHSNTYKAYTRNMVMALMDSEHMNVVNQWLTGRGKLRTNLDRNGYFMASIITGLPYASMAKEVNQFQVGFRVSPFFCLDSGEIAIELNSSNIINNIGTLYSEPCIKIYGSGNIDLFINNDIHQLIQVEEYIVIDSSLKLVYKDTMNQGEKMIGDFPIFEIGNNNISWTGDVSKLEIVPRWREL